MTLIQFGLLLKAHSGVVVEREVFINQAMEESFRDVALAFTGEMGFAQQLQTVLKNYTDPYSGMLANKEKGLQQSGYFQNFRV